MAGIQELLALLQQMGGVEFPMDEIEGMFPPAPVGGMRGMNTSVPFIENAGGTPLQSPNTFAPNKGTPWGKIAGGVGAGIGLLGAGSQLFGGGSDFDKGDIDSIIRSMRQSGTRQVGSQLSRANVATAGNMASRGLGSSTMTTGALGANQAAAMDALANLESSLGMTRGQLEQFLAQLQAQERAEKLGFFGEIADVGLMALLGL